MSLHLPSRRVVRSATALISPQSSLSFLTPCIQTRLFWGRAGERGDIDARSKPQNPLTEEYLKRKPKQQALVRGDLAESSIFEDEEIAGPKPKVEVDKQGAQKKLVRNPDAMAAAIDPDPRSRERWERKMVIKGIHKRGRLTRTQQLKREERVILSKSHDFKTSVKKLMPLARQIAGKTVEEAIIQMRFSKKQVAKDVKEHLEHARNEAIVKRGMGLGLKNDSFTPVKIQTKDGKRVKVEDPTTLYVDQAWCGKGLFGRSPDHRARGNIHIMKNRTTSLSLVLREEKTRIRQHNEREQKAEKKKLWVQLPNRPITAQRQYYSW
ncbi:probable mitochondrial large ribosomal subunit [Phialocephala subalpina]|uniref:Probable mitochondrial large ribosomal subunit n=1 Tax=Phialocephala subalpina TaxID=576137 RepID=A0A1L7X6A7_9HELO|nr:probable mitochondrial large ribosomal subunit [Phialocephala subalpina]